MLSLIPVLFTAGVLTVLLPCILPLIPIVLGTSIAGRSRLRPLFVIVGMLLSFVAFTFVLVVALGRFPGATEIIRISTYYLLLLFGVGFLTNRRTVQYSVAVGGALFFWPDTVAMLVAAPLGCIGMFYGARIAAILQNFGANIQQSTQHTIGADNPLGALMMGSTLGLVWVPCAGPALSFVLTLLRERPGTEAVVLLTAYGLGTALPLLAIGYGGQYAVHSVRVLSRISGKVKEISGVLLILSALGLQFHWFRSIETWFVQHTAYGTLGTRIEEQLLGEKVKRVKDAASQEERIQ